MEAIRLNTNPLITPAMLPGEQGGNINGPSVIGVPQWVPRPLGRYYMYFAHHGGQFIRLAAADDLAGPWRLHEPGVLHLQETAAVSHVASPDVHVDEDRREIRMYFHGCRPAGSGAFEGHHQVSFLARSTDGLSFAAEPTVIAPFYMRALRRRGRWYALAKDTNVGGMLLAGRDADGAEPFEPVRTLLPMLRHAAWRILDDDRAELYFSRAGDNPERIVACDVQLADDPADWAFAPAREVLAPAAEYEGAALPAEPSTWGAAHGAVRQLRDPAIYVEGDRTYLFYSIAGEQGIAAAELVDT